MPGLDSRFRRALHAPLRITLVYLAVGALWILLSDRILEAVAGDGPTYAVLQTLKGWIFVGITAGEAYSRSHTPVVMTSTSVARH